MLYQIINGLIPIFICVVLPIAIVWMVMKNARFRESKRTEVLLKAIESGKDFDANMVATAMSKPVKPTKSPREILNIRLAVGCCFLLISIIMEVLLIVGCFVMDDIHRDTFLGFSIWISIPFSIGVSFLIMYFVTRKYIKD